MPDTANQQGKGGGVDCSPEIRETLTDTDSCRRESQRLTSDLRALRSGVTDPVPRTRRPKSQRSVRTPPDGQQACRTDSDLLSRPERSFHRRRCFTSISTRCSCPAYAEASSTVGRNAGCRASTRRGSTLSSGSTCTRSCARATRGSFGTCRCSTPAPRASTTSTARVPENYEPSKSTRYTADVRARSLTRRRSSRRLRSSSHCTTFHCASARAPAPARAP